MPGTAITTAFIPVRNPQAAADWYSRMLGLTVGQANNFSAVLSAAGTASVTLMPGKRYQSPARPCLGNLQLPG